MHLNFVIAGFSKCGTTTLCALLTEHPRLFMPPRFKEPRFFNRADYALYWNWYQDLFYTAPANALLGEGSVSYTEAEFAPISVKRLAKHFPEIKVILIARDPVDRIESSYREMHNSGTDWAIACPYDLEEALLQIPNMLEDTKYWEILQLYRQHLPAKNILVLFQEDLRSNPEKVLKQCFNFLGIEPIAVHDSKGKKLNRGTNKYYDTPRLRALRNIEWHPKTAKASYLIPSTVQNQFMPQLNLRKPFGNKPIEWSANARTQLLKVLGTGPVEFLSEHGKDISFWPRFAAFLTQQNTDR